MSVFDVEKVLSVHHWTTSYFSFRTTRGAGLRFENGQFVMIGLPVNGKPLMRAYSVASPNWDEEMEFFSIKVPDGPLTSRLQHLKPGDEILLGKKPTGTLLISDLHQGRNLYLLSTGTGLAPFLSVARDPATFERFEKVIIVHGVRLERDLAYRHEIEHEWPRHEFLGEMISRQLLYYPAVSREPFVHHGRVTDLLDADRITSDLGLAELDPKHDRAMICGSPQMLADFRAILDRRGFNVAPRIGTPGEYVFERAFVEK